MKYINKLINPEIFQNKRKNNYFEGWYYKIETENNEIISFIPGISIHNKESHAFIQVITNKGSKTYYFKYDINEFKYNDKPFSIEINNNYFSLDKIKLNLHNEEIDIKVDVIIKNITPIKKSIYAPNIMGPFAYLNFLECYHGVISLFHNYLGIITINNKEINMNNTIGYLEKDWGSTFPSKYIWIHGQSHKVRNSFFLSIANIPFLKNNFTGFLAILYIKNKEYRFTTYNLSKIKKISKTNNLYTIIIKKRKYKLEINLTLNSTYKLLSPNNGNMINNIKESLDSVTNVLLYKNNKIIYDCVFNPSLAEIEWFFNI